MRPFIAPLRAIIRAVLRSTTGPAILVVCAASMGIAHAQAPSAPSLNATSGEVLARRYCQACHLFPTPDLLDRKTWATSTLRRMAPFLGVARLNLDQRPDGAVLRGAPLFPNAPTLSQADWQAIVAYYLQNAPVDPLPQPPRPPIGRNLDRFSAEPVRDTRLAPAITLVRIAPDQPGFELGDARLPGLHLLGTDGRIQRSIPLPSAPTRIATVGTQRWITTIGDVFPSDALSGHLLQLPMDLRTPDTPPAAVILLSQLKRPVDFAVTDLTGDQRPDLVVAQFGNYLGKLSWFEGAPSGGFQARALSDLPGALQVVARDFTGDGRADVLVQMAQGREGFFLHENRGDGTFLQRTLLEFPPAYGSTSFELVDMDGDQRDDLLVTHGDNGEYESPFKRYHGIRIFEQRDGMRFTERWFFPMNGAFKALARDFDGDGDRDIVAISFFPDFEKSPEESLIYLENQGNGRFVPATIADPTQGRWLTLDAGDIDEDGDLDVVVGAFNDGPRGTPIPATLMDRWKHEPVAALILRNRTAATR